jgi:hypothetical protein
MASPSWSFNNGVISDSTQPGWSYDLNKQKGSAQNLDQAMTLAKNDWQSKFDPGRLLMSNDLTATSQGIGKQAGDWGAGQTWNTSGNPMASRPDVAPSQPGFTPSMGAGSSMGANGQILNAQGQPQGTPQRMNALTGQPSVAQRQGADWGNSSGTQAGVTSTPGAGQTFQPSTPTGARPITQSLDELTSPADKFAAANALKNQQPNALTAPGRGFINEAARLGGSLPQTGQGGIAQPGFAALTGGQGGIAPPGSQPGLTPPATGPGAGRGYPSNWNANNAPGLNGDTTFATNPATGASYETSPMYQFQQKAGEKSINRALRSRGRYNSSVGVNALANFNNQLGAQEANQQYNRVFDQQKLGLQAALAQAQSQGASSAQLAQLYAQLGSQMGQGSQNYGANITDLIHNYGLAQTQNMLSQGSQLGQNAWARAGGQLPLNAQSGQISQDMIDQAIAAGLSGWNAYSNRPK